MFKLPTLPSLHTSLIFMPGKYEAKDWAVFMLEQKNFTRECIMRPLRERFQELERSHKSSKRAQLQVYKANGTSRDGGGRCR